MRNPDDFENELNQLIQDIHFQKFDTDNGRPPPDYSKLWFPTPETCTDLSNLSPLQREIYDQILQLQRCEKLNPKTNSHDREEFLKKFAWETCVLSADEKSKLEDFLVEYHDVFAKHRFDVGYNTELKIKLTPAHQLPVYVQGPPAPIHLRDEILVELALLQYFNIITTLSHSKYSSPIFVHRKPSGKLRILIDLRRVNHLLRHDYLNSNFPISNMTDATNHFAGKKLFCKLDCSQAYHCVQMADDLSVQLLAFIFASRTFAYNCLAQGLNKSVTGFSSFVKHLDKCLAANVCTQFMDDIAMGVNNFDEMIPALTKIFDCLRASGLKLSAHKCEFGTTKIHYLGSTITPKGISPEADKINKFLEKIRMPETVKQVKRLIGFVQFFRSFMPNLGQKLLPFYKLLRKDVEFKTTKEHNEALDVLKTDLRNATNSTLRLAKPGLQYVLLCDASYHGTGFVLMIEDYLFDQQGKEKKVYAPVSFGSRLFGPTQLKFSVYYKEFLALYFALDHFAHFIWGATKPVLVLTDNRSLTQFFQSKSIHPSLWNCLDRVLSFNILLAHIPGKANSAADFLSRMQTDPTLTLSLKLTDRIPIKEIEIATEAKSPDVALSNISDRAHFPESVDHQADDRLISQLKEFGLYEQFLQKTTEAQTIPSLDITGFYSFCQLNQINLVSSGEFSDILDDLPNRSEPIDLALVQNQDEIIREVMQWKDRGSPDMSPNLSIALRKYRKQFPRLIIQDKVLYRLFYDDQGKVQHKQFCVPKSLWREVIYRLHNSPTAGHMGINKTVEEFRKRFYFPNFTEYLTSTIQNCLQCLQLKRVPSKNLKTPLQPVSSLKSYPGEMLQIDLVGPLQSPLYRYVLTGIDVFTKYLFAVPLTNGRSETVARELASIFFCHSYLPKTILSDLGTTFVSELMHELTKLLEIKLEHASLKHPQTVGVVERSHSALKRILKLNTTEQWNDWYKYVQLAAFIHNTYHFAIGTSLTTLFHGREPLKPLDLRFNTSSLERAQPTTEYVLALQDAMLQKFSEAKSKLTEMYNRYRAYYDYKAEAQPLKQFSFCLLLNPKLMTQSDFSSKFLPIWLPLYRVEQVLTNSNYIIRKVGTNYTQCVHRIRLRPVVPQYQVEDLQQIDPDKFQRDPMLGRFRGEPAIFDESIPTLLLPPSDETSVAHHEEKPPPVIVSLSFPIAPAVIPVGPAPGPAAPPLPAAAAAPAIPALPAQDEEQQPALVPNLDDESLDSQSSPRVTSDDDQARYAGASTPTSPAKESRTVRPKLPTTSSRTNRTLNFDENRETVPVFIGRGPKSYGQPSPRTALTQVPGTSLLKADKRTLLLDSCQRTRPPSDASPRVHQTTTQQMTPQSPQEYLQHQKEVKARYNFRNLKKRLSSSNVLNSISSDSHPNFCFSSLNILDSTESIAHCVSADFQMKRGLASAIAYRYPTLRQLNFDTQKRLPPGSLVSYFDRLNQRYIYNLVTKKRFFHKPKYETLQLSLMALRQHLERHKIRALSIPRLGSGLDRLHWPTVFSILYRIFSKSPITITIVQPPR